MNKWAFYAGQLEARIDEARRVLDQAVSTGELDLAILALKILNESPNTPSVDAPARGQA